MVHFNVLFHLRLGFKFICRVQLLRQRRYEFTTSFMRATYPAVLFFLYFIALLKSTNYETINYAVFSILFLFSVSLSVLGLNVPLSYMFSDVTTYLHLSLNVRDQQQY